MLFDKSSLKNYNMIFSFDLFRGEQCHLVKRLGEIGYIIDLLEKNKIDYYWKHNMKIESILFF